MAVHRARRGHRDARLHGAVARRPAYALFGTSLRELANGAAGFEDLLGRDAARVTERLAEGDGTAVLDDFLGAKLRDGPEPPRQVLGAWHRLVATRGRLRIDAVAEDAGWTRRHLSTRFRSAFGLGPKTFARILRLQHAASLTGRLPWSEIAHHCGYADQQHLNRDFRALAGCTPTDFTGHPRRGSPDCGLPPRVPRSEPDRRP